MNEFNESCVDIERNEGVRMVKFNGINHLAMATGDMDRTIRFWRDLLGMRLVAGLGRAGFRHYFFEISDTDLIAFFEWTGVEAVSEKPHGAPVKGPFIFDHVSFGVEEKEHLWELRDRLEAAGYEVSETIDHGFIYSIYTHDPNGIPIEFSWNVEGVDIRGRPTMIDREASAVTREGAEPQPGHWPEPKGSPPEEYAVRPGAGSELAHGLKNAEG